MAVVPGPPEGQLPRPVPPARRPLRARRCILGGGQQLSRLIAVAAALGGSVVFGISSVAEQRGTKRVKRRRALSPRILLDLARQPLWGAAIGGSPVGLCLLGVPRALVPPALLPPSPLCAPI